MAIGQNVKLPEYDHYTDNSVNNDGKRFQQGFYASFHLIYTLHPLTFYDIYNLSTNPG